jgi:hypothetical protein
MFEETCALSTGECRLHALCREESLIVAQWAAYWKQQGKFRALKEGNINTRYFHARASARSRWNAIRVLEVDGTSLITHDDKMTALTAYYSDILGSEVATTWGININHIYDGRERVDQGPLPAPITGVEARCAIRAMCTYNMPGPDGVGLGLYTTAWVAVKPVIMQFISAIHNEEVDLQHINRALIVLIPKSRAAVTQSAFCPVSLQNCLVEILTKLLTSRLQQQIARLVDVDQTGCIKGRSISENFVVATELV